MGAKRFSGDQLVDGLRRTTAASSSGSPAFGVLAPLDNRVSSLVTISQQE